MNRMNRPYVQIESENKISTLRRHLEKMLPEFEALPGVVLRAVRRDIQER